MMLLWHARLRVRTLTELARHHEREDAREIGLQRDRDQVEHQRDMLVERLWNTHGGVRCRDLAGIVCLRTLDPPLDLANVVQVFAEAVTIGRTESQLQL